MGTADDADLGTDSASVIAIIAEAIGSGGVPAQARVCAAPDPHSPEEGLALLSAYVAIRSSHVRQAILDAVVAIADRSLRGSSHPYE